MAFSFGNIGKRGMTGGGVDIGGIGTIGQVLTGIVDAGLDYSSQQKQLEFEKSQLRYQKQLQAMLMNREDTAMQRRVLDLKMAGLSPVLAAGGSGAGSGPVVSTVTPTAPKLKLPDAAGLAMSMMKMKADVSATVAQEALLRQQVEQSKANTLKTTIEAGQKGLDYKNQEAMGASSGGIGNTLSSIRGMLVKKMQAGLEDQSFQNWEKEREKGYQEFLRRQP